MQSYVLKDVHGNLFKMESKVNPNSLPGFPQEFEVVGLETVHNPNGHNLALSKLELQEVEAAYDVLVSPEVLAQPEVPYQAEVLAVEEKWTKTGEADVFVDPQDPSWTHVPAVAYQPEVPYQAAVPHVAAVYNTVPAKMDWRVVVDSVKSSAKSKEEAIKVAYDTMNQEVYAEMAAVFGTTNPESATAYNETWKLMKTIPAEFVGTDFVDEAAVIAYADLKLAAVLAYAKFRMNKIKTFQLAKAAILAS